MSQAPTVIVLDPKEWGENPQTIIDQMVAGLPAGLVIDATASGGVTAQVAQVLLAAKAAAHSAGVAFNIGNPPKAVRESLALLGLSNILEEVDQ